jgi:hypothetical protein
VAEAVLRSIREAGPDGMIHVKAATPDQRQERAAVEAQDGLRFPLGVRADGSEDQEIHGGAAVLVSLRPLEVAEAREILANFSRAAEVLLCLCPGLDPEAANLFRKHSGDGVPILLCADPQGRWQDCFEDVAVESGARLIGADERGPVEIDAERFGAVGWARIEAGDLVIAEGYGTEDEIQAHIERLRRRVREAGPGEEGEWHASRLAQLVGGVVEVALCGGSPEETEQLEGLAGGVMHAGRAMIAGGYVGGGGAAHLRGAAALESAGPAAEMLRWALEEPIRTLLVGSGMDAPQTLAALHADENLCPDVVRGELVPWRDAGPIDPARTVKKVIESATERAVRALTRLRGTPGGA